MRTVVLVLVMIVVCAGGAAADPDGGPLGFFQPSVSASPTDVDVLRNGGTIARVVPGAQRSVAVFSATAMRADADRLVEWTHAIGELKKSKYVTAIGRFSSPPRAGDLAALVLDDADIADVQRCRPGRCGIKLAPSELDELRRAGPAKEAIQAAFRHVVLSRVEAYLSAGQGGLPSYDDHGGAVSLQAHFAALLQQSAFLRAQLPEVAASLERWPQAPAPRTESFLYWSKEQLAGKAVISVTHVMIVRLDAATLPDVVVIGRQVFATHYTDASLSVTAVVRDGPGPQRFLLYLNRSDIDVLGGFWGGLLRRILERRLRAEAPAMLVLLRQRLESGGPPGAPARRPDEARR